MAATVSYCGLICQTCPIYFLAKETDKAKKEETVSNFIRVCKEEYGIEYTPEDITDCSGCTSESGILFSGCKNCRIRKCAIRKQIPNCAYCKDYACEDLLGIFKTDPNAKTNLDQIRCNL